MQHTLKKTHCTNFGQIIKLQTTYRNAYHCVGHVTEYQELDANIQAQHEYTTPITVKQNQNKHEPPSKMQLTKESNQIHQKYNNEHA